jgi:hypothetical protein
MASIPGNGCGIKSSNLAGNPAAYTGIVIAEAEDIESLGKGWEPVSVQLGYPAGTNLVTVLGIEEMDMSVAGNIANLASCVSPHKEIWPRSQITWDAQYAGALVITEMQRVTEGLMGSKTNADYANELWESARVPMDRFKKLILTNEFGNPVQPNEFIKSLVENPDIEKRYARGRRPEQISGHRHRRSLRMSCLFVARFEPLDERSCFSKD